MSGFTVGLMFASIFVIIGLVFYFDGKESRYYARKIFLMSGTFLGVGLALELIESL